MYSTWFWYFFTSHKQQSYTCIFSNNMQLYIVLAPWFSKNPQLLTYSHSENTEIVVS